MQLLSPKCVISYNQVFTIIAQQCAYNKAARKQTDMRVALCGVDARADYRLWGNVRVSNRDRNPKMPAMIPLHLKCFGRAAHADLKSRSAWLAPDPGDNRRFSDDVLGRRDG